MKTISKVLLVPVVAVGLLLSGLSFDALACSNGLCSLDRTSYVPQKTRLHRHHHFHYATWWGGCGCGCGCDYCGCGGGCCY